MSIQSKLKARAAQHALEAEKARQLQNRIHQMENQRVVAAMKLIRKALEDFEIQVKSQQELKVTIPYACRLHTQPHVYIIVWYQTREVQYADDMLPEQKRCLEVQVGWHPGSTSFICGPEQFEESFIRFIEQNYVVTQ